MCFCMLHTLKIIKLLEKNYNWTKGASSTFKDLGFYESCIPLLLQKMHSKEKRIYAFTKKAFKKSRRSYNRYSMD